LEETITNLIALRIPGGWTVITNIFFEGHEYYQSTPPEQLPQILLQIEKYPVADPPFVLKIERTGLENATEDYQLTLQFKDSNSPLKIFALASRGQVAQELEQWLAILSRHGIEGVELL
jgi:hypothetical protein